MINPDDFHLYKNHFENNLFHGLLYLPAESILTEENKFLISHPPCASVIKKKDIAIKIRLCLNPDKTSPSLSFPMTSPAKNP